MAGLFNNALAGESVRPPTVAGQFYPADPRILKSDVEKYLALGAAKTPQSQASRIIISPHAGYVYSGPVAGSACARVDKDVRTVILLGPPHRVPVTGIAVPEAAWFATPLGSVRVDRERIQKLLQNPIAYKDSGAHALEHSLEVQLPFLQVRLGNFSIVPMLVSDTDPQKAADAIFPLIDDHTLVVASSDFSHYQDQTAARRLDDKSIAAIMAGDMNGPIDACGEMTVRVVMALAKRMGLHPRLVDARTSYETHPEKGTDARVVGYAAIIYSQPADETSVSGGEHAGVVSPEARKFLVKLARISLEKCVRGERSVVPADPPAMTKENYGCFVTLTKNGALRGCIGYIEPVKPLYQAIMENARNAALSDPRFPPVALAELPFIKVEVSVLTKPVPLAFSDPEELLAGLVPHVDGVILQNGLRQSTFLPQVWEQLPDKQAFLEALSLKAGLPRDGWKTAQFKRYRAEHFSE